MRKNKRLYFWIDYQTIYNIHEHIPIKYINIHTNEQTKRRRKHKLVQYKLPHALYLNSNKSHKEGRAEEAKYSERGKRKLPGTPFVQIPMLYIYFENATELISS